PPVRSCPTRRASDLIVPGAGKGVPQACCGTPFPGGAVGSGGLAGATLGGVQGAAGAEHEDRCATGVQRGGRTGVAQAVRVAALVGRGGRALASLAVTGGDRGSDRKSGV